MFLMACGCSSLLDPSVVPAESDHRVLPKAGHCRRGKPPLVSLPGHILTRYAQAYAPLVRATKNNDPTLVAISKTHGVSSTQVLVRWSLQRGFVPLPKSDSPDRIKNNADVFGFELTEDEMAQINAKSLPDGEGAICPYLVAVP